MMPEEFRVALKNIHNNLNLQCQVAVHFGVMSIIPFDGLFHFERNPTPHVKYPQPLVYE